jgi:lipopolysaccharide export system permease protein
MPFFRLIDRYILSELFKPFLAGVIAFMIIMISNTLYIFMELIVKSNIDPGTVGRMLAFNLPAIVVVTLPVAYMFATLLALGRLGRDSEIIALRAAGVSLNRIIASVILAAILISAIGWGLQEKVVPWANQQTVEILKNMMKREPLQAIKEKNFLKTDGRNFYVQSIDRKKNILKKVYIMDQSKGGHPQIITAETATRKKTKWILNKGLLRKLDSQGFVDHEIRFERMEIEMELKPELIFNNNMDVRQVASGEAAKLIDEKRKRGEDTRRDEMDYHTKFSLPLATFFTILLAAPIGIRFSKMGNYFGVAISIALVFVWYLAYSTFTSLGATGTVPPVLAAWVQNLAFGIAGVLLLLQMQDIKIFAILFWPLLIILKPFREAVRGRPLSLDPDDKPPVVKSRAKERKTALLLHFFSLPGFIWLPLIVWLRQRRRSEFVAHHARNLLNFQLSLLIHAGLLLGLTAGLAWIFLLQNYYPIKLPFEIQAEYFLYLGLGLIGLLLLFALIAGLSAAIRAAKSQLYQYPMAIPFIKSKTVIAPTTSRTGPLSQPINTAPLEPISPEKTEKIQTSELIESESKTAEQTEPASAQATSFPEPQIQARSAQSVETPVRETESKLESDFDEDAEVKAERLSSGFHWRNTWFKREEPARIRVWQRGGALAKLTLLTLSVILILTGALIYDQTQIYKLSFSCQSTPQAVCAFQEQSLMRNSRHEVPISAIRDVLVIPKEIKDPKQKATEKVFDLVLQTTQNQIWITSVKEEASAHILASNIRLFAQGYGTQTAPIEQLRTVPLVLFGGGLLLLLLLIWLLWPLRWRREFALNIQNLSLKERRGIQSYPLSELGELILEPGRFDLQNLTVNWQPHVSEQAEEERTLLLARALTIEQAESLLEVLRPWLKSAQFETGLAWTKLDTAEEEENDEESEED